MAGVPAAVTDWLNTNYPRPRVDPEWLDACYDWLTTDQHHSPTANLPGLLSALESQLLQSNLADSMLHGTGIPIHLALPTSISRLSGPPVLVEITTITEIGVSAFQLDQVRRARQERFESGVGMEEGEEDGDVEVEGEGPMPKYSRGMLRLELTDGVTTLQAIEHRRLKELDLGKTPLGYKMQLTNTRIHRGMAFLEPESVIMKGGKTEDRDIHRERDFERGLRVRMGLPLDPLPADDEEPAPVPAPAPPPAAATVRSPLREISPPPSPPPFAHHNDDEDLEPRRRKVPTHYLSNTGTNGSAPKPSGSTATTSAYFASSATASSSRPTGASSSKAIGGDWDMGLPLARITTRARSASIDIADDSGFDFDFLDEIGTENQPPSRALPPAPPRLAPESGKGKAKETPILASDPKPDPDSDDFWPEEGSDGGAMMDVAFMEGLDRLEMEALGGGGGPQLPSSGSGSGGMYDSSSYTFVSPSAVNGFESGDDDVPSIKSWGHPRGVPVNSNFNSPQSQPRPRPLPRPTAPMEVISLDSDGEEDVDAMYVEDKENMPVATRHVRRRTVGGSAGGSGGGELGGRPVVRATNPGDVIDISDSD